MTPPHDADESWGWGDDGYRHPLPPLDAYPEEPRAQTKDGTYMCPPYVCARKRSNRAAIIDIMVCDGWGKAIGGDLPRAWKNDIATAMTEILDHWPAYTLIFREFIREGLHVEKEA